MPSTIKIDDELLRKAIALIDREEEDWIAEEINDIRLASPQYAGKSLMEICHLDFLDEPGFREELEMEMYRRMGDRTQAEVLADFINDRRIVWAEWAHEKKKLNQDHTGYLPRPERSANQKERNTMTTQNQNPFYAPMSDTAEFERLEDGVYNGVCVGVELREYRDYNDPNATVQKATYIFQVAEGGQTYYFRTKPLKVVIGEKSNLFILINTWTGASLEKMTEGFSMEKMVGYPAQLVINTVSGKDGKQYANLANVLKVKKGTKVAVVPDAIPAYLVRNSVAQVLAEGITVKPEESKTAKPYATMTEVGTPAPAAPAGAKVTQAADAKGWIQNPPAQPADAVPNVGATAEDDSDDMDLPF